MSASRIPVKGLAPEVLAMTHTDGFYLVADKKSQNYVVPMISMGGKIFMLIKGQEVDPMKFLPTAKLSGPFVPTVEKTETPPNQET